MSESYKAMKRKFIFMVVLINDWYKYLYRFRWTQSRTRKKPNKFGGANHCISYPIPFHRHCEIKSSFSTRKLY